MNIKPDALYKCPYTNIEYRGNCPVSDCPANVTKLGRKSGCAYNFLGGKKELDEADISYVFNVPVEQVRERINIGKARIHYAVLLNEIVTRIRDKNRSPSCQECGVLKPTKGNCLNKKQCDKRKFLAEAVCSEYPYNIPELKITKTDVFLIVTSLNAIKAFVTAMQEKAGSDIKVSTLLGINKDVLAELKELSRIRS